MKPRWDAKRQRWWVASYQGGRRRRWSFTSKAKAEGKVAQLRADREGFGQVWLELEPRERAEICGVLERIKAKGLTLRQVWDAFEQHGLKARGASATVTVALARLANEQLTSNLRPNYIRDVARCVRQFARGREESLVDQFTKADVDAFVADAESPNTRATRRGRLLAFFSFCQREKLVAENVVLSVAKVRVDALPPQYFTPQQCQQLMALVEAHCPGLLAWTALALFAGVRPEDCDRMTWKAINLETGEFSLEAASSKLRSRATIPLTPNCLAWLIHAQERGAVLPVSESVRRRLWEPVKAGMGLAAWPQKVLRHTFCTYGEKLYGAKWVSQRARHSEAVLFKHYNNRGATELNAKDFFNIEPNATNETHEHHRANPEASRRTQGATPLAAADGQQAEGVAAAGKAGGAGRPRGQGASGRLPETS